MHILFSKTDALGDQLLATGTIAALLDRLPDARVLWLVRAGYEAVADLLPGSRIFPPDLAASAESQARALLDSLASAHSGSDWARVVFIPISLNAYATHPSDRDLVTDTIWWMDFVRALSVDVSIAGTVTLNWVDQCLTFASLAPQRIGHKPTGETPPVPGTIIEILHNRSVADSFTHLVDLAVTGHECDHLAALALPLMHAPGYAEIRLPSPALRKRPTDTIVITPGAGDLQRVYPVSQLAAAVSKLSTAISGRAKFVILSGPKDGETCAQLAAALRTAKVEADTLLIGPRGLPQAQSIIGTARLLISSDSFWVHLASALGTPTVAIWGLGHWPRFIPRQGQVTVLHTIMLCQNCNWLCCFDQRHCITDTPVAAVASAAAERLLSARATIGVKLIRWKSRRSPENIREALYLQARRSETLIHECNLLQAQLADLQRNFDAAEQDRLARGDVIAKQGQKITQIEGELDTRLKELTTLYPSHEVLKNERNLLQAQLADLQRNFDAAEQDRLARGDVIAKQGQKITQIEGELDTRLKELTTLYPSHEVLKNERNLLQAQLADLQRNFDAAEQDRLARGDVIAKQGQKITQIEGELDTRLKELTTLYPSHEVLKNERNLLQAQLADLKKNFDAVEQDRLARGSAIEEQGRRVAELEKIIWLTERDRDYWKDLHIKSTLS